MYAYIYSYTVFNTFRYIYFFCGFLVDIQSVITYAIQYWKNLKKYPDIILPHVCHKDALFLMSLPKKPMLTLQPRF